MNYREQQSELESSDEFCSECGNRKEDCDHQKNQVQKLQGEELERPNKQTNERRKKKNKEESRVSNLYDHCFVVNKVNNGESLPVGGESRFSGSLDYTVEADFESEEITNFFEDIDKYVEKYEEVRDQIETNFEKNNIENLPIDAYIYLRSFYDAYEENYGFPVDSKQEQERLEKYSSEDEPKLSSILKSKGSQCAELSALLQRYLQEKGVNTKYISGDLVRSPFGPEESGENFSEAHSYLFFENEQSDQDFIFDASDPVGKSNRPGVYFVESNFQDKLKEEASKPLEEKEAFFVPAKRIYDEKESYYGVSSMSDVQGKDVFTSK